MKTKYIESEMITISRIARKYKNSSFFHVIVQGINKEYIFHEERFKKMYLKQISRFTKELNIEIIAYCIMSNHAHFLIMTKNIEDLSKLMQKVDSMYAKYYNYSQNRVGYVFRDRFLSEVIDSKRYFIQCIKYIHLNPVKANIVNNCKEYEYSSYRSFIQENNYKNNQILNEILTKLEYKDICDNIDCERNFLDIEQDVDIEKKIKYGIQDYIKLKNCQTYEIYMNRNTLKELIQFLKEKHKIKYTETQKFFEIKRGTMEGLKTYK